MEKRISFKRTMESIQVFQIVALCSLLFQAAAYITDCNMCLHGFNGTDYIPQTNRQTCLSEIGQPIFRTNWRVFRKEYPQIISLSKRRTLKQPETLEIKTSRVRNQWNLVKDVSNIERYAIPHIRRNRVVQLVNEFQSNIQRKTASDQRIRNMIDLRRGYENKKDSQLLSLIKSRNSRTIKESNRRYNKDRLNQIPIFSQRILDLRKFRSVLTRDTVKEMRNSRQTKYDKEKTKHSRYADNFDAKSFMRLFERERHQICVGRCNKFLSTLGERKIHEKQLRISMDRFNQEIIHSGKHADKRSLLFTSTNFERKLQEQANSHAFSHRIIFSGRAPIKNVETQQRRRTMERLSDIIHSILLPGQKFQNTKMADEKQKSQNRRQHENMLRVMSLHESSEIQANIRFSRNIINFVKRIEDIKKSSTIDVRAVNERHIERSPTIYHDKIQFNRHKQRRHSRRNFMGITENVLNLKASRSIDKQEIHKTRTLYSIPAKVFNVIPSEISPKSALKSFQRNQYNKEFERTIQMGERRVRKEDLYHESRQHQKDLARQRISLMERRQEQESTADNYKSVHSHVINTRISRSINLARQIFIGWYRNFLNRRNNDLSPSRRNAENRFLGETLQRTQHQEFTERSSGQLWPTNRLKHFVERNFHSRLTGKLLHSRVINSKSLEQRVDKKTNVIRSLHRAIRSYRHLSLSNRIQSIVTHRNFLQDTIAIRENRLRYTIERRHVKISEMSSNSKLHYAMYWQRIGSGKLYRYSEMPSLKSSSYQTNIYSNKETKKSLIMRTLPAMLSSRTDTVSILSTQQKGRFKTSLSQSKISNLARMTRKTNDDTISWDLTSFKLMFKSITYQPSITENKEGIISHLWNTAANVIDIVSNVGFYARGWKTAYIDSSLDINGDEMKQELFSSDYLTTNHLWSANWQDFGMQNAVIAGIGIFAAIKLGSAKSMDYENHKMTFANIGCGI